VVTLKGELIDTSGTMSGGGGRPQTGGMSASNAEPISPAELRKLEDDLKGEETILLRQRQDRVKHQGMVKSLSKEVASFEVRIKKCNMGIAAAKKAEPELEVQVGELTAKLASVKGDVKKQASLEKDLAKATAVLDKALAAAEKYEAEVKRIELAIKSVGGVPLKAARSKLKSLNNQIESQQSERTKSNVGLKTAKSKLKKTEKKIAKDSAELEKTEKQVAGVLEELSSMEEGAEKVLKGVEEAQRTLKEKDEVMKTINTEHKAAEAAVSELQSLVVDLEEDYRAISAVLKDNQSKAKHWKKQISKLELHKVGSDYFDDDEDDDEEEEAEEEEEAGATAEATPAADGEEAAATEGGEAAPTKAKKKSALGPLSTEELDALDAEAIEQEITVLEEQLGEKKPNVQAIQNFYEKEEQYIAKVAELDEITEQRDQVRTEYEDLRKQRLDTFFAGFKQITTKLKEMYQMITLGGDAELEYVDNINPFSEGIVFSVRPPRKSWKAIQNLSGGEKTLSSLALVFALHHYKPNPLYVMDEIDAALDFKNVSIVAHYIKERTKNAQFIIISLRNNMFELADRLVGIYKTDDCTKTVTINPAAIAAGAMEVPAAHGGGAAAVKVHESAVESAVGEPLAVSNA